MKIPVTIWTIPVCVKCDATKRMMDRLGIIYEVKDLTDPKNADALADFKRRGYITAPIVTTDIKIWADFRHDKIQSLHTYIRSMERH